MQELIMIDTFSGNKILLIGDVHGRINWQSVADISKYDLIIFMGDYFDPYESSLKKGMYENFEKILEIKKENPNKVLLLIGNHDLHYMYGEFGMCSRFSITTKFKYGKKLRELRESGLMQMAYMIDNYLFVHAGVSMMWLRNRIFRIEDEKGKLKMFGTREEVAKYPLTDDERSQLLVQLNNVKAAYLDFDSGPMYDIYGMWPGQTPVWIRPSGLIENSPKGIVQVIGHTQMDEEPQFVDERGTKFFMCDNGNYYTEIIDGEFITKKYDG